MKKVVRLTENDLARIIKRVIAEQTAVVGAPGTPAPSAGVEPMTPEEQKDNQMLASTINNMGLPMDAESIDELDSCPVDDEVDPKVRPYFDAIRQKIEAIPDVNTLFAELKNVLSVKRRMKRGEMSEQAAAAAGLAIAGVTVPMWAVAAVAALVVILIVKTIINRTKGNKSYRRKKRHLKKGCYSKKNRKRIHSFLNN